MRKGTKKHEDCKIKGCTAVGYSRGWCRKHYELNRRTGDPLGIERQPKEKPECAAGCGRPSVAAGFCSAHYSRQWKYGDVGSPEIRPHRVNGVPAYNAAHRAVTKARGSASTHECIACGGPAKHWALRPDAKLILVDAWSHNKGLSYSLDVDDYWPMCVRHHRAMDAATRRLAVSAS